MFKRMLTFLVTIALAYGVLVLLIYAIQDRLVYFPVRDLAATPRTIGAAYEDAWLTTEDGVRIHGWFVPVHGARATVLHLHGNGGNISHRLERIAIFRALGFNIFLIDYRGYGKSEGRPSEEGTYLDARAGWHYLVDKRGLAPSDIILHGESLGGGVATELATEQTPAALIVESSFSSMVTLGSELYPWLPVRWVSRYTYPSQENLARVRAPLLVIHSRDDEIIPFHHAQALFAAAADPKQLLEIRGDHNGGFVLDRDAYVRGLGEFLQRALERPKEQPRKIGS